MSVVVKMYVWYGFQWWAWPNSPWKSSPHSTFHQHARKSVRICIMARCTKKSIGLTRQEVGHFNLMVHFGIFHTLYCNKLILQNWSDGLQNQCVPKVDDQKVLKDLVSTELCDCGVKFLMSRHERRLLRVPVWTSDYMTIRSCSHSATYWRQEVTSNSFLWKHFPQESCLVGQSASWSRPQHTPADAGVCHNSHLAVGLQ